jgi:haloalkane dehalogenase
MLETLPHAAPHTPAPPPPAPRGPGWLDRSLYPFPSRWLEVEGSRLHYVDEGAGRPLLFVHGTPSWSFEWRATVAALRGRFRCIAVDHLGFGLSDKPADAAYRPEAHARRLRALVEALDLRDVVLVVHDFGGPIGLPLALERGGRVSAVVAMNTWMWSNADRPAVARLSRFVASPLGRWLYLGLNASPRWLLKGSFADTRKLTAAVHRHYLAPFPTRAERVAPWVLGCELAGSDASYASLWERREALATLPLTLVWGRRDPALGADALERWRTAFPHARVVELEVGHFPQEEAAEEVTRAVAGAAGGTGVLPAA